MKINAYVAAQGAYDTSRSASRVVSNSAKAADTAISTWLQAARAILTTHFGNRWSTMWAQAGFVNGSTAIPNRIEDRMALTQKLAVFLTTQPSYEDGSRAVTAKEANRLRAAAVLAQQGGMDAQVTQKTTDDTRQAAQTALMTSMRMLISILKGLLGKSDPRWNAFGLPMPSMDTTPGQPVNLTAQLDMTGAIIVRCDATPLATRYRWRMLLAGVETQYRLVASTLDSDGLISGVLPGQTAQIIVQAVNGARQGVASEPIKFTVPMLASAKPEPVPAVESVPAPDEVLAPANGHGANGHTNGTRMPALS